MVSSDPTARESHMGEESHVGGHQPARRVVGIAASAGGVAALPRVLGGLPAGFAAAVVVVQHLDPDRPTLLTGILARRTPLAVVEATEGAELVTGTVYVAPPDHHVLVTAGGRLALTQTDLVHHVRPAADVLFASMATTFGDRSVGVVLSGTGKDASGGAQALRHHGGTVFAQDEATSEYFGMPGAAIETGAVDRVLAIDDIAAALVALIGKGP